MHRIGIILATFAVALFACQCFSADDQLLPVSAGSVSAGSDAKATVEHLLKAAEHLQAAGLVNEAWRVSLEARRIVLAENLVARKEAELECLLEELDHLRRVSGESSQIEIDLIAFEFTRSRLGRDADELDRILGLDECDASPPDVGQTEITASTEPVPSDTRVNVLDTNPARELLFQKLIEQKQIQILSRPTFRAMSREAASLTSGPQVVAKQTSPERWESRPVGRRLSLEMLPIALAGGRLRLQAKFEVSDFTDKDATANDDKQAPESFNRILCTTVEMRQGQTLVLVQAGKASGDREIVLLATPRPGGYLSSITPSAAEPIPAEAELTVEELLPFIQPADYEYFPVTPVPRKGTAGR
ncbi:MAG: hypothetical protein EXS05_04930 [Planctomycetaceae bacterium]|nr:hypothetical protein [Planctomycetaceae bacterium]